MTSPDRRELTLELFRKFDLDKDNKLTRRELKFFVAAFSYKPTKGTSKQHIRKLLRLARKLDASADPNEELVLELSQERFVSLLINFFSKESDEGYANLLKIFEMFTQELEMFQTIEAHSSDDGVDDPNESSDEESK